MAHTVTNPACSAMSRGIVTKMSKWDRLEAIWIEEEEHVLRGEKAHPNPNREGGPAQSQTPHVRKRGFPLCDSPGTCGVCDWANPLFLRGSGSFSPCDTHHMNEILGSKH